MTFAGGLVLFVVSNWVLSFLFCFVRSRFRCAISAIFWLRAITFLYVASSCFLLLYFLDGLLCQALIFIQSGSFLRGVFVVSLCWVRPPATVHFLIVFVLPVGVSIFLVCCNPWFPSL